MHGLEKEYAGKVDFVRVNVLDADNAALMKQFGFSSTPEMYLVDRAGKVVRFWDAEAPVDELRTALNRVLGSE